MEVLTLSEFEKFFNDAKPRNVIYDTKSQAWHDDRDTLSIVCSYQKMLVFSHPNCISFKGAGQSMCLDGVKYVQIHEYSNPRVGLVFTVICGDKWNNENDIGYTFVTN